MPTRMLREGILESDKVNQLSAEEEVFYRRLMSVVDDYGRIESDPRILRARCFPLRVDRITLDQVKAWTLALSPGLITLYQVKGKGYLEFLNLGKPRADKSKFPAPPRLKDVRITSDTDVADVSDVISPQHTDEYRRIQVNTSVSDVPYSNSVSYSSSYSCAVAEPGSTQQQQQKSDEPCEPPCADIDLIARSLASDLHAEHSEFGGGPNCLMRIERLLADAVDPVAVATATRTAHNAYLPEWREKRARNNRAFVPSLAKWLDDGDYLNPPRQRGMAVTIGKSYKCGMCGDTGKVVVMDEADQLIEKLCPKCGGKAAA